MVDSNNYLSWDSDFFGFNVCEILVGSFEKYNSNFILNDLLDSNIKLAYHTSNLPLEPKILSNNKYEVVEVIRKVPILKKLSKSSPVNPKISLFNESFPTEDLIKLAQLAGRQGRFGMDPNISEVVCDRLFEKWIINSVNKQIADEVYVYKENNRIVGFSTTKIVKGVGFAPLFAVERDYEGKGIAFALMSALENIFLSKGCKEVYSDAQEMNKKALKVYERYGFIFQKPQYVYHFWKK